MIGPDATRMRKLIPFALVLISAVVAIAAYLQALNSPFVYDDVFYITDNAKLAGLHLSELWHLLAEPYNKAAEFLPLRDFSFWLDIKLFGLVPSAFRLHNIFLYLLCLPLVYGITSAVWQYSRPADAASAPWAAAAVTALFALHPAHIEAVVWISGRKDVLSGLFSLLALWLALRARREQGLSAPYAAATLIALLLAMYSKASAVTVAAVIAMIWLMYWRSAPAGSRQRSTLWWSAASLLLALCVAMTFAAITTQRVPFYFGLETATRALAVFGWLVRLAVSPESHHFFYPVLEDSWLPVMVAVGAAALAAAGWGAVALIRKPSLEGFAVVVFLLLCLTSLQLVPYKPPSLVSDRFLFLAVWAALLLLVALSWRLSRVPRTILLLAVALTWGFQTVERPRDWRTFEALLDSDLRAYPGYYMPAYYKVVFFQLPKGQYREASELANRIAIPEVRDVVARMVLADQAIRVGAPSTGNPYVAMDMLVKLGRTVVQPPPQAKWNPSLMAVWLSPAEVLVDKWADLAKEFPDAELVRYNAGLWMSTLGHYEAAAIHLRATVESQRLPEYERGNAFKNLGIALFGSGRFADAEAPLRKALEQSPPDLQAYCVLSAVYKRKGQFEEAARAEADCPSSTTE